MEYRKICNICGKIWCYTDEDIKQNTKNAGLAALSSIGAIANVFAGTRYDAYEQTKMSDRAASKIRDFCKCPDCGSADIRDISAEEFGKMQKSMGVNKIVSINSNASVDSIIKRIELFMEDGTWDDAAVYCEQALDLEADNGYLWLLKLLISYKWKIVDGSLIVEKPFAGVKIEESEYYERINKFAEKDADLKKKVDKIKNDINECRYKAAVEDYSLVSSDPDWHFYEAYEDVKQKFLYIKDYKDSARYAKLCQDKINEIKEHNIYLGALKKLESGCIDEIKEAKAIFQKNSHWDDAGTKINECDEKLKMLALASKKRTTEKRMVIASLVVLIVFVSASWMINHRRQMEIKLENASEQLVGGIICGTYRYGNKNSLSYWSKEYIEIEFLSVSECNIYRRVSSGGYKEDSEHEFFYKNREYHLRIVGNEIHLDIDTEEFSPVQPYVVYFDKNNDITEISTSNFNSHVGMKMIISSKDSITIPSSQGSTAAD